MVSCEPSQSLGVFWFVSHTLDFPYIQHSQSEQKPQGDRILAPALLLDSKLKKVSTCVLYYSGQNLIQIVIALQVLLCS